MTPDPVFDQGEIRSARIEEKWRYWLLRRWDHGPVVLWVMLNPSTADGELDDATIRKCRGFSQRWGFAGLRVVNLYALRSRDKRDLRRLALPAAAIGPDNDRVIAEEAGSPSVGLIVVAWGTDVGPRKTRPGEVLEIVRAHKRPDVPIKAIWKCKGGQPGHPLLVGYRMEPFEWTGS